jgi:hypothetical protein
MSLLEARRRAIAEGLLGTTLPAGPQMEPEVGFLEGWAENTGDRLGFLGSLLDPMTWYRAIGSMPSPDSPEAKKLFRRQGEGLLDVAMDWGVNPLAGGALGIFKGMGANLSDDELRMLQKAFELEQSGASREAIRQATNPPGGSGGWFRAPWDQKWRMEVDDSQMRNVLPLDQWIAKREGKYVAPNVGDAWESIRANTIPEAPVRLSRLYEHKSLARAYPYGFTTTPEKMSIMDMPLNLIEEGQNAAGTLGNDWIALNEALQPGPAKSTGLHELQHMVQRKEGFASGGNPEMFAAEQAANEARVRSLFRALDIRQIAKQKGLAIQDAIADYRAQMANPLTKAVEPEDHIASIYAKTYSQKELKEALREASRAPSPQDKYRRLAGEAEARLVQARRDLTPQQRALLDPIEQMDTMLKQEGILGGLDDLIVRYGDGPAMAQPRGLLDTGDMGYRIQHRPMQDAGGAARLHDLTTAFGEDIYGPNALQYYGSGGTGFVGREEKRVLQQLQSLRGKPDAKVTIYRGIPSGAEGKINPGDWVTLSPKMAAEYGEQVVKMEVPASDVTSWADSLLEFGYFPKR